MGEGDEENRLGECTKKDSVLHDVGTAGFAVLQGNWSFPMSARPLSFTNVPSLPGGINTPAPGRCLI